MINQSLVGVLGVAICVSAPMVVRTAAAQGVDESPVAKEKIDAVLAAYRSLKTYQCTHERAWVVKARDGGETEQSGTTTVYFEAPARFAMVSKEYEIRSDGTSLVVRQPVWKQYISTPVGEVATLDDRLRVLTDGREGLPLVVEAALRKNGALNEVWPGVRGFTDVGEGASGGRECWWITAVIDDPAYRSGLEVEQRLAIDQESGLIVRTVADFSMAARSNTPQVESAIYTTTNRDIIVDQPIDAAIFTFTPGSDDRKVDAFEPPPAPAVEVPAPEAAVVAANPAPAFTEKDLEGKEVTLASFKGRVLVLDFWATWCGPCISAMPAIQHLADTFKGKPVDVVGVNLDRPGMDAQIRKILKQKNNTMRQIIDPDSSMGNAYGAEAIPLVVIIDQKGVVRHRHVGYAPRGDEVMAREIEALLRELAAP